jgi:hypothetical protein
MEIEAKIRHYRLQVAPHRSLSPEDRWVSPEFEFTP